MRYHFYTADVFTNRLFGGNQLAVLPDADGLSPEMMQRIANEFSLSETAFVTPGGAPNHFRVRIFTPDMELPFAGHPSLGTAHVLAATGRFDIAGEETAIVLEEEVGPVPVTIRCENGYPISAQLLAARVPEAGPPAPAPAELAALLSLDPSDLSVDGFAAQTISCGVPFLFVPLPDRDRLARIRFNVQVWQKLLAGSWAPHVYCLTLDPELEGSQVRARMFAPAMGIAEDPATGAAASALPGFLGTAPGANGTLRWRVEQGFEMGRPSLLEVEADRENDRIIAVRVGGSSVLVCEGHIHIPSSLH